MSMRNAQGERAMDRNRLLLIGGAIALALFLSTWPPPVASCPAVAARPAVVWGDLARL